MIQNLSQLKKALKQGSRFEITEHFRPECVGQIREITMTNSVGFYSKDAVDPENKINLANDGRGSILWWEKASHWNFQSGLCSFYVGAGQREENRVISFRVLEEDRQAA